MCRSHKQTCYIKNLDQPDTKLHHNFNVFVHHIAANHHNKLYNWHKFAGWLAQMHFILQLCRLWTPIISIQSFHHCIGSLRVSSWYYYCWMCYVAWTLHSLHYFSINLIIECGISASNSSKLDIFYMILYHIHEWSWLEAFSNSLRRLLLIV